MDTRITTEQAENIAIDRFDKSVPPPLCGYRITLPGGRNGTVVATFCCVADLHSGWAHLDGDPPEELHTVSFYTE